jgi:hypothetical protein
LSLCSAFNAGNIDEVSKLVRTFVREDAKFRKCTNFDGLRVYDGNNPLIEFFDMLYNAHPDGVMTVKSVSHGVESGLQVIRSKIRFTGSCVDLDDSQGTCMRVSNNPFISEFRANSKNMKRVFVKVQCKIYLDEWNRIIIFDENNHIMAL